MLLVTKAPEQELHELSCVTHDSYILPKSYGINYSYREYVGIMCYTGELITGYFFNLDFLK